MAFDKLQSLGEEKFRVIMNHLLRGKPAMTLAREIQQEWGDLQDIGQKTLTQQLNRLRIASAEGIFGKTVAAQITKGQPPKHIARLNGLSLSAVERMEELSALQKERVIRLLEKEKTLLEKEKTLPTGSALSATSAVFNDYKELLKDIQKMRFDLGLDEYKGVIMTARGASVSQTFPDGSHIQKQVFEAATTIDEIFARRNIPIPSQADREGGR
jgi:DNA-binding HxlR family transcriptional regulator